MASRKRSNQEKQSHGQRTNDALNSVTPSNNLSAQLLIKPETKLPTSKFSARFQTKGTRNPINRDVLIKPSTRQSKFAPENVPDAPNPAIYRSATNVRPGMPGAVSKDGRTWYTLNRTDLGLYNTALRARTDAQSRNTTKSSNLASDVTAYNRAKGTRSSGPNRVL
jgi:hypothetical protein